MSAPFCLPRPQRRKPAAAILPLINVVFLLLMFIVLAGVIRTPDPFALTRRLPARVNAPMRQTPIPRCSWPRQVRRGSARWPARTPSWPR
jgi:hypothetical protein